MKIKKIIKAIIICFILNLTIILSTKLTNVNAAISLDLQNSYFTESDSFTYLNSTYTIFDYKNSIETQGGLFASNVELLEIYSQLNVFGDDPIIKIIPKEYFHTIGSFSYIGKEYGYFIQTVNEICYSSYENENTGNYRSYIIVFDIEANTDLYANVDKAIFTVRVLFELEFITIKNTVSTIWRKSDASQTESIDDEIDYNIVTAINNNSNLQYCVVPLFDANRNAKTNRYYLNDVSFAGTLQNEQELNETDSSYVLIDTYGTAGGIAGRSYFAEINNCSNSGIFKLQYIVGSITKENDNPSIGGIVGHLVSTSSVINCKLNNNNEMIIYCGEKCKDIMLSPCLGLIVGRNVGVQIVRYDIEHQVTINSGNLQEFKTGGFLGINAKTYKQARYVSNNNEMPCGKVG